MTDDGCRVQVVSVSATRSNEETTRQGPGLGRKRNDEPEPYPITDDAMMR